MESEDRKPIFTKRLILTILAIILIILIILLLLKRCGKGGNEEVIQISVSPTTVNLEPKDSLPVYAEINSDGIIYWMSSDETCATVNPTSGNSVTITAGDKECTTIITAHSGETKTDIPVTVTKTLDKLEGLQLSKSNYTVYVGKSALVSVTPVPTTAQLPELTYRVEDTSVATVDANGVLKGISVGTTTLIVSTIDGSLSVTSKVTVKQRGGSVEPDVPTPVEASGIEFNASNDKEVCVGSQIILGYIIKPDNATNKNVTWSVNDPTDKTGMVNAYSSVDENGYLTGVKAGTTKVTITSKDNPKLIATTTITVLSSSSSKCKSSGGGGSHTGGSGGGGKTSEGTITISTGTNGGMSCTVTALPGAKGWYKSLTINWKYTPTPGLWDDGNYNRQWCKGPDCNPMPGSSYSYTPDEDDKLPKFWYRYTNKNGENINVEDTKSGSCSLANTKLDTKNPTCKISSKLNGNVVEITVEGSDSMSGVNKLGLNGSYQTYTPAYTATYTVKKPVSDSTVSFSGIVYDEAGRSGVCSAKVNMQTGSSEDRVYAQKINLHVDKTTLLKGQTTSGYAWILMSDGSKVKPSSINVTGGSISQSGGNTFTFTPDGSSSKATISVTAVGLDGDKPLTSSISINITEVTASPKVSLSVNCTRGNAGWCKSEATVSADVQLDPDSNDKVKSVKVCAGSSCTPSSASAKVSTSGIEFINYSLTTEKLGTYVSKNLLGTVKVDVSAPTCTVAKSADGTYLVKFSDVGSGLANYTFDGSSKTLPSGNSSSSVALKTSSTNEGKTITVTDVAGNTGSCQITDTKLKLSHLNFGAANPVTLEAFQTKSVTVYPVGTDNAVIIDRNASGITVSSGNANCFTATALTGIVSITGKKVTEDCSGQVVVTSTYDSSVKGFITVKVKKYVTPTISLSNTSISLEKTGSKTTKGTLNPNMAATWSISGGNTSCFTSSINANSGLVTVSLKSGVTASCNGTFKLTAALEDGTRITSENVNVKYDAITVEMSGGAAIIEASGSTTFRAQAKRGGSNYSATYRWTSSNSSCATVDSNGKVTGRNTGAINCTSYITVGAYSGSELLASASKPVVVKAGREPSVSISSIRISSATASSTLTANVTNGDGVASYAWTNSNSNCATVGRTGKQVSVTGKNTSTTACTTTVTVSMYDMRGTKVGNTASATVTVPGVSSYTCSVNFTGKAGNVYAEVNYNGNGSHSKSSTFQDGRTSSSVAISGPGTYSFSVYWDDNKTTKCTGSIDQRTYDSKKATADAYACGSIASRSNTGAAWTKDPVTVTIECTGAGCQRSTYAYTWNGATQVGTGSITIYNRSGNSKTCSVPVNHDGIAPTCRYTSTAATTWARSRSVSVQCSDSGSGCKSGYGTRTLTVNSSLKTVNYIVMDNAGNSANCGDFNVYVDVTKPTINCSITSNNSVNGVTVSVTASDGLSGLNTNPSGTYSGIKSTRTFTVTDKAGNTNSCKVNITTSQVSTCPTGYSRHDEHTCWSTTGTAPTIPTCSLGTYNSSSRKCEYTTGSHSGTSTSCPANCTAKVTSYSASLYHYNCNCTASPTMSCASGSVNYMGTCYKTASLVTSTQYKGSIGS